MSTLDAPIIDTSTRNRSAISNGSWLLDGVDNRSALGRRYRDLCMSFADDLGGADKLTEPQRALVRQLAAVTVESEKLQSSIVRGEHVDHESLVRLTNLHARLLKQLGVKATGKSSRRSQSDIFNRRTTAA
ncbi:hypothetical protein EV217_2870 [Phyllobacterium myrsinacearum]|uniref:hypothetical protein n=1 Tax=Phyllobacterium myrsinacearum TaxID=28101 RepID=UPI00102A751A|nr:hypothetical protein [Phyllobacterium myrsinacearum]RZS82057.1 hypothetical protein EV217_2870 [Phyllobacterium myrsinacearum]